VKRVVGGGKFKGIAATRKERQASEELSIIADILQIEFRILLPPLLSIH
jgi:hypothetical protein